MQIQDVALIKTGAVLSRLSAVEFGGEAYRTLSLKNIDDELGLILKDTCKIMRFEENVSDEFFTRVGDILVRLSSPYTAVYIDSLDYSGLLVPSHFAIIRADKITPGYLYAMLDSQEIRKQLLISRSGSTTLGTISVKSIAECVIPELPVNEQKLVAQYHMAAKKELRLYSALLAEKQKLARIRYVKLTKRIEEGELL